MSAELIWKHFKTRQNKDSSDRNLSRLRNKIAVKNQKLVQKIAHRQAQQCAVPFEDLNQVGMMGLLRAIDRFDPTTGSAFSSFAVPWIRGEILHYLRDHGTVGKIPRRWRELNAQANKVEQVWLTRMGRMPQESELAEELRVSIARLREVRGAIANQAVVELNEDRQDLLFDVPQVEETGSRLQAARLHLQKQLGDLGDTDRSIVEALYFQRKPRKQVALQLHISTEELRVKVQSILATMSGRELVSANLA